MRQHDLDERGQYRRVVVVPPGEIELVGNDQVLDRHHRHARRQAVAHRRGNDAEAEADGDAVERLHAAIGKELKEEPRNALIRDLFLRLRKENLAMGVVEVDTPYAAAKTLPAWNPGSVMFDLNLDQLVGTK